MILNEIIKRIRRSKRVKTPTILQMEMSECGAVTLAIILGYYKKFISLEELRRECGISMKGSKAIHMKKAAQRYGLVAKGFQIKTDDFEKYPFFPMILFWEFNHFVVLEGISKNWAYINDPATGPRRISMEELETAFTGIILAFQPSEKFKRGGKKRSIICPIKNRLKGLSKPILYIIVAGLFLFIPGMLIPIFSKIFVDDILINHMYGWLKPLLLAMALTALLRLCYTWLQNYCLIRMENMLSITTSSKFFYHLLSLPLEFFAKRLDGDISSRLLINDKVASMLSRQIIMNFVNLFMIFFYAMLMLFYDKILTLISIIITCFNIGILIVISRRLINSNRRLQNDRGKLMGVSMSGLQLIETIKANGSESDFFATWSGYQAKLVKARQEIGRLYQISSVASLCLSSLTNLVVLITGAWRVMGGHMSIGMLAAFQSLTVSFIDPFEKLIKMETTILESQADMERLDDVLHHQKKSKFFEKPVAEIQDIRQLSGHLELRNISFGYNPPEEPFIMDFSLILKPGSRVALVGRSGSGKSTLAKLIMGLYRPWNGEILFNNTPLNRIPRNIMHNSIAMVDQDIFIFEGTIQENLSLWDSNIPETDIIQAAKDAHIHNNIIAREGGYMSKVEEGGRNFSGGERQRLEIARALAKNPSILILDEATSSLDPDMEKIIDDNIRQRGCACLIIAHRLSTIRDCDEIIVLNGGKVVQRGTHESLYDEKDDLYAQLIKLD